MSRAIFRLAIASVVFGLITAVTATAQDFQKSYRIGAGDRIHVNSVSGNVIVTGYDGSEVIVSAFKEGRDREMVEVEDLSTANSVEVRSRYPKNCNCNASIRFEVKVPRSINYNFDGFSTASGDVKVSGVKGSLRVRTASGDIDISEVTGTVNVSSASGDLDVKDVTGSVSARTASGDVDVEIARFEGNDSMEFRSASGDVSVRLPGELDADVEMVTHSGEIETDFPIQIEEKRTGSGRAARGRVGSGSRTLRISAASGNVTLKRL